MDLSNLESVTTLPLLPLRGMPPFLCKVPALPIGIGRDKTKRALRASGAMQGPSLMFLCTVRDENVDVPRLEDLYSVGMISVVQTRGEPRGDEQIRTLHGGVHPARLLRLEEKSGVDWAHFEILNT